MVCFRTVLRLQTAFCFVILCGYFVFFRLMKCPVTRLLSFKSDHHAVVYLIINAIMLQK